MDSTFVLSEEEKETIERLHMKNPKYAILFQRHYPLARKRTLHQLVQAIVREQVVEVKWGTEEIILPAKGGGMLVIPIEKRHLLDHIDIGGDVEYDSNGTRTIVEHPAELIALLPIEERYETLRKELENSVIQYALALTGAELRKEKLSWNGDMFSYLVEQKKTSDTFSPLVFAEQWVIDGHTLHPCSKTRIGLSIPELIEFSPEWGGQPSVIPIAVHKNLVRMTSVDDVSMTARLLDKYPHVKKELIEQIGSDSDEYELIPVHPWQIEHTIKHQFKQEIEAGSLIPLESAPIETDALMSFRSLAPKGSKTLPHLKTAVDIQMTSAKRIVSPTSVWNGPLISKMLKQIESDDQEVSCSLRFLEESAGGHFQCGSNSNREYLMKNLSALLRENPEQDLAPDEIAVPAAFLINRSPFTSELILTELVKTFSKTHRVSLEDAAVRYIEEYAGKLLPGLLKLICKYGISLEAHLQNAVPVFKDGIPVRFLLRDNGGIRIKQHCLEKVMGTQPIDNKTNLLTDSDDDLYTMFSHALFHNHLGEMIHYLSKDLHIPERSLWNPVKQIIVTMITRLKDDTDCMEGAIHLEKKLRARQTPLKALVKMRLSEKITDNAYTLIPNPLIEEKEGVLEC